MKRALSLLLVLCLFIPVLSLAEEDGLIDEDEILIEEVEIDENGNEVVRDEDTGEEYLISTPSEEAIDDLASRYEADDSVDPNSLDINPNLPDDVINILLIGVDTRGEGTGEKLLTKQAEKFEKMRSDVLMILSFNKTDGSIRLSSIARDVYVTIPGRKGRAKINESVLSFNDAGKSIFNPERCIRTVNYNFEMNIQYYVAMNFYGVASIIEYLGGVDIDLTKAEAKAINAYLKKNKKQISRHYDDKKGEREALKAADGVQHLDGLQGLMYARLRSVDNDRARTGRVRHLLDCLLQSVTARLKTNELDIMDVFDECIQYPMSNMSIMEMMDLAMAVLRSGIMDQVGSVDSLIHEFRIPEDGTFQDKTIDGSSVTEINLQRNKEDLHAFIYGRYIPAN